MQDRAPMALVLVALVAAMVVTTGRFATPPAQAPAESSSEGKKAEGPAIPAPHLTALQCASSPPTLEPLCMALYDPDDRTSEPLADWTKLRWVERARSAGVRFLIAMVADPEESGDTLRFDRSIEALQSVAESLRYSFMDHCIPWEKPEQEAKSRQTAACGSVADPGSLLFRVGDKPALVVFLVGESAISGIRQLQFLNAIYYAKELSSGSLDELLIAGPNNSGSLDLLAALIGKARASLGPLNLVRVISPSVTVLAAAEEFRKWTGIDFRSVVHSDNYANERFERYAERRWWLSRSKLAVLRESSTAFGRAAAGSADVRVIVQFPRGIFRLRNASPEASARALFTPEAVPAVPQSRLSPTLRGPGAGKDRVPSLSAGQTPVTQEAVLLGISSALKQEGTKFAQIVSSDPYDTLFVAGFLKRAYPALRPYFLNADLLNVRASELLPLEGSLSVTTYPLIPRNQIWSGSGGLRTLNAMSSRFEIGMFNAVSELLGGRLLEYSFPGTGFTDRPPLWLTVVATDGYWPVALLDKGYHGGQDKLLPSGPVNPEDSPGGRPWPSPGEPTWHWHAVFVALLLAGVVVSFLAVVGQTDRVASQSSSPFLGRWAVRPEQPGAAGRAYFAMGACLVMAVMIYAFAGPVWAVARFSPWSGWMAFRTIVSAVVFAVAVAGATAPLRSLFHRRKGELHVADIEPRMYKVCMGLGVVGFVAFLVLWTVSLKGGEGMEGFFFCYRSFDVLNGVNPVMPFLFLCTGLLVLIALHQRRHASVVELVAELPDLGRDILVQGLRADLAQATEPLAHPLLSGRLANWPVAMAGLLTLLFLPLFERQQTLEGLCYDMLHWSTLVALYVLVVLTWARFLVVWMHLRPLLGSLAATSLRAAFADLPAASAPCSILRGRQPHRDWAPRRPIGGEHRAPAVLTPRQFAWVLGNVMVQLRSLLLFVAVGFFLGTASTLVYPFRAQEAFGWAGTINFLLLGLPVLVALAQVERHPLLATPKGQEDRWRFGGILGRLTLYLALPLVGVIGAHFPALGRALVGLLQPAAQLMR